VATADYDIIGDLEDLRPPATVPPRRHPDTVTDAELAAAGVSVIAAMMTDVRRLARRQRSLRQRTRGVYQRVTEPAKARVERVRGMWPRS